MKKSELDLYKAKVLGVLINHIGRVNAISMRELYREVFGKEISERGLISDTRVLRALITKLRDEGTAICSSVSKNGGGYYLAAAGGELADFCSRMHNRALKILTIESKIRKMKLRILLGQMRLNLIDKRNDAI